MKLDIKVNLEPGKVRAAENTRYVTAGMAAPPSTATFVAMEQDQAVFRIRVRGDQARMTRALKKEARYADVSLRDFVRVLLSSESEVDEDRYHRDLHDAAQVWADSKGMKIEREGESA